METLRAKRMTRASTLPIADERKQQLLDWLEDISTMLNVVPRDMARVVEASARKTNQLRSIVTESLKDGRLVPDSEMERIRKVRDSLHGLSTQFIESLERANVLLGPFGALRVYKALPSPVMAETAETAETATNKDEEDLETPSKRRAIASDTDADADADPESETGGDDAA